ncbi:DNA repair protein RAD57 [Smittium culicis]|uniref:DNA repair protein RAD57 n=1 Tax=Smittium culicis TaxID=133412 RepID=A0A1R1XET5_9FUNG|nr:DNA repair protein RAD57 [Smittium culicis]
MNTKDTMSAKNELLQLLAKKNTIPVANIRELNEIREKLWDKNSVPKSNTDLKPDFFDEPQYITTGNLNLDNLLDGGISTEQVTEIFGPTNSGKTKVFLITLSLNINYLFFFSNSIKKLQFEL